MFGLIFKFFQIFDQFRAKSAGRDNASMNFCPKSVKNIKKYVLFPYFDRFWAKFVFALPDVTMQAQILHEIGQKFGKI